MGEEERVRQIMVNMAKGNEAGKKLGFDPRTKTIRVVSKDHDPDSTMEIDPEDATLGGTD